MKASPWARCARWRLRPVRLPTWFQRVPTASWGSLVHYWVALHRQSIDNERTTTATDICVLRRASGAHGAGSSGGGSVWRLQPTSAWPQVPPMRFLSLTERNIGVPGPLDAVSMHFDTLFTFTPHPIPNGHVPAVSPPRTPQSQLTAIFQYYCQYLAILRELEVNNIGRLQ